MTSGVFNDKASLAVHKNFIPTNVSAVKQKNKAVALCKSLELTKLAKGIGDSKKSSLTVFFRCQNV
ncbi:hypothetical protein HPB48_012335 [Haemaphysalis longicornis]|uniref:Uncharacterized protein n=1 Tax=Haemaphysalis longicornis TaxID=44386 RepID=A0A9J6G2G6_HAELO|nr:hypothetical protein HPB48_012335 [Haemaphysalis longicornis]